MKRKRMNTDDVGWLGSSKHTKTASGKQMKRRHHNHTGNTFYTGSSLGFKRKIVKDSSVLCFVCLSKVESRLAICASVSLFCRCLLLIHFLSVEKMNHTDHESRESIFDFGRGRLSLDVSGWGFTGAPLFGGSFLAIKVDLDSFVYDGCCLSRRDIQISAYDLLERNIQALVWDSNTAVS